MLSIDGLVTGIDTESIINGLMEIQQRQINQLESRRLTQVAQQTAVKSLEAQVAGLRSQAAALGRSVSSPLAVRTAKVSDESAVIASASSQAAPGVYDLRINSLAQAHQVASQSFADLESEITQGTFTFRRGSQPEVSITIDSNNDTLQGLADSINSANAGVSATIVQDGIGGYRLLMTSTAAGSANAITVTNGLDPDHDGAVKPAFDFDNPVQAATNASVTLGTGSGAITVQSATNQVDGLIGGVTLNLLKADPSKIVTLRVERDTTAAKTAVQSFVTAFNDVMQFIDTQTAYNAASGSAGVLQGNRAVLDIQQELRSSVLEVVPGANPRLNRLTAMGISVGDNGRLIVNEARLSDVLNGRVEGVTEADVRKLFALDGSSTNTGISFVLGSNRTKASTTPYEVDITQAARRASITADSPFAALTSIDGSNDTLSLTVDGQAIELKLSHGDYSRQALADAFEQLANEHPDMAGRRVRFGIEGSDRLSVTSMAYGSNSTVKIDGGTALDDLGLTAGQTDTGSDVVGRFIVNGEIESAVGRGRTLSGESGNANTADLQVLVTLSAAQVQAGAEGEVTVTRGVASRLDQLLNRMLDVESGKFRTVGKRYDDAIQNLQTSIDRQNAVAEQQKQRLIDQFVALESAMSQLQSTSTYLNGQLASLGSLVRSQNQ